VIDCIARIGRNRSITNGVRADRSDLSRIPMDHKRANRSSYNVKRARPRRSSEWRFVAAGRERKWEVEDGRKKEREDSS